MGEYHIAGMRITRALLLHYYLIITNNTTFPNEFYSISKLAALLLIVCLQEFGECGNRCSEFENLSNTSVIRENRLIMSYKRSCIIL